MLQEIIDMMEDDLVYAISDIGAKIIIQSEEYDCVLTALDEREDQGEDAISVFDSATIAAVLKRSDYNGNALRAGRDTVTITRHGTTKEYRIATYGVSASGHSIRLELEALRQ